MTMEDLTRLDLIDHRESGFGSYNATFPKRRIYAQTLRQHNFLILKLEYELSTALQVCPAVEAQNSFSCKL